MAPSYIAVLNVYAFSNVHDVSWGTKGDNKPQADLGKVEAKGDNKNEVEVIVPTAKNDINALYEDAIHVLNTKKPKEVQKVDDATKQEDYYRGFRTNVLLAWTLSNALLAAVVASANDTQSANTAVNGYMAFILFSVAGLALIRFVGSTTYMVVRLFAGESPTPDPGSESAEAHNGIYQEEMDHHEDESAPLSDLITIRVTQEYIQHLQSATLENGDFNTADVESLLNPPCESFEFDDDHDCDTLLSIRLFMASQTVKSYNASKEAVEIAHPTDNVLSYDQVKRLIANITGVQPIVKDMCQNSCMAYTGPLSAHDTCLHCGEPRYNSDGDPHQTFDTIPIPFAIQALMRHAEMATEMGYFFQQLRELLDQLELGNDIDVFDDIACGYDILQAAANKDIAEHDILLMLSFDGCQIYRNKASDCWVYIWMFVNLAPGSRYKKKFVFPGATLPGPNKIKDAQSYLYVGLLPIAAINRHGGLPIWNASTRTLYKSKLYIVLATADGPGMVYLNGLVGHSGKIGCRLWCGLVGRKKPGSSYYFPLLSKPNNYVAPGCDHDDVPAHIIRDIDADRYNANLALVVSSRTKQEYELNRRETGICRPSIFSGLPNGSYLGVPRMFPGDIMHLILNLADLLIPLWRGKFECAETDSRDTWFWAVLKGDRWQAHGRDVARCTPYLPGSFDRPPRNPAEKINSGYKAWEFLLYLFGLGPGLFYRVLPTNIWRSYCKLVSGIRIIYQKSITREQIQTAHLHLIEFITEFESIQHSDPYKHLSRRAVQRAEINCLKAMVPTLDRDRQKEGLVPRGGIDLGGGYVLLRAADSCPRAITDSENKALQLYLENNNQEQICRTFNLIRWARLRLPNGQVARSAWKEAQKPLSRLRMARNVKLIYREHLEFGEVHFYFRLRIGDKISTLAMIDLYSRPNSDLLRESSYTLWTCKRASGERVVVVDAKAIQAVVCMAPHSVEMLGDGWKDWVFLVEKPGLDIAELSGVFEAGGREDEEGFVEGTILYTRL
ncbi:hypothetical protein C0992_009418 [Termitomyces sp. T32_za158]|nr:hypothetical protein C0992_009418 [Termitomyces sp. T32_za158]